MSRSADVAGHSWLTYAPLRASPIAKPALIPLEAPVTMTISPGSGSVDIEVVGMIWKFTNVSGF